ncbi:hypothetical protein [Oceanobacillus alkalisoli]|nr:hypothetical protein [Oceanobacillus alkalisoli]MCF3941589.1 hypothetical protein [Oceanobacillus alkalisoli]
MNCCIDPYMIQEDEGTSYCGNCFTEYNLSGEYDTDYDIHYGEDKIIG